MAFDGLSGGDVSFILAASLPSAIVPGGDKGAESDLKDTKTK